MIKEILESKKTKTPYLFKNILPSVPNWDNFLNHLDSQYQNIEAKYHPLNPREKFINGVLFKDPFASVDERVAKLIESMQSADA